MESAEEYISRMLEAAQNHLSTIVSLSGTLNQVGGEEMRDALEDEVSELGHALSNALEEVKYLLQ